MLSSIPCLSTIHLKKIKKFQNILTQNGDRTKNESSNVLNDAISVPIRRSLRPVQKRK